MRKAIPSINDKEAYLHKPSAIACIFGVLVTLITQHNRKSDSGII